MLKDYHDNPSRANPGIKLTGVQYERNPDAEYGEHIRNVGAMCNTSASHTYGNALSIIEKYLTDTFPIDFKTITASTTLASRQVMHLPKQLYKKELPAMVLIPRIVFGQDENRFLANTLMNSRYTNTQSIYGDGSLLPLAEDRRKGIYIHGHYNRAVMYVDVILSFNTYSEQINCMSAIHNLFPIMHNQYIRAPLELYIPSEFCDLIGHLTNTPVVNGDGSVYKFLTYMNSIWHHPITYKLKGGSNTDEFFMYYLTNMDVVFQEPQPNTGTKDGQLRRGYEISFTIRCDFNTIGYFTLNSPNIKKPINIMHKDEGIISTIFADSINLNDFQLPVGWSLLGWPIFKLNYGENSISIDNILNQSLRATIDYHLRLGLPMEKFICIQFRENGQVLDNESYYIDWVNRRLVLLHPNHRRTYKLVISVSHEYINNLVKELYKLE